MFDITILILFSPKMCDKTPVAGRRFRQSIANWTNELYAFEKKSLALIFLVVTNVSFILEWSTTAVGTDTDSAHGLYAKVDPNPGAHRMTHPS